MKIARETVRPMDFEGLKIIDYTTGKETSSSFAEISVPSGATHRRAFSKRSDKYYYVVSGHLEFEVDHASQDLNPGDVCVILKGQRFSYRNTSGRLAKLVLVHTPSFDLESEVFEE
jgi:mannose-6-phosphate isomerase-like protein (cupin superfamily)